MTGVRPVQISWTSRSTEGFTVQSQENDRPQELAPLVKRGFRGPDVHMTELKLDPVTGFLESSRDDGITGQVKRNILDIYATTGNLTAACLQIGVDPRTIRWHIKHDPAFEKARAECWEIISDKAEGHIVEWMGSQKNVIDRLAWLRAHRPDRWNPKAEVSVTHNTEVTVKLAEKARHVLDTTAVESPPGVEGKT